MLTHPTLDQLRALKLDGMAQAFVEIEAQEDVRNLAHAEWLALLLDREADNAWNDFQASRARDAVYGYLEAVFAIVAHHKVRRKTKKLLRHAFEFAELPFDKNANAFSAVIRCTCDDNADDKAISKWARLCGTSLVARCQRRN
jgi:hypothetical protein